MTSPPYALLYNPPSTTKIYTLSLHDALPISQPNRQQPSKPGWDREQNSLASRTPIGEQPEQSAGSDRPDRGGHCRADQGDRKSTRLNSSHVAISYAVFCLKKKKQTIIHFTII